MKKHLVFVISAAIACVLVLSGCESKADKFFAEGMTAFEAGEYKTAERKLRKALDNGCEKEEASEIIEIIENYSKVEKYINNREFSKAAEAMEKMPDSYEKYSLSDEIDEFDSIISSAEEAADMFEMLKKRYEEGEYENAVSLIDYVDEDYLASSERKELDEIKTEIESNELSKKRKTTSASSGKKKTERVKEKTETKKNETDENDQKTENKPEQPNNSVKYRVRKSADDAESQIGAFSEFDNAKRLADANSGYSVFDMNGLVVYQP